VEGPEKLLAGQSPGGMVPFNRASSHLETTEKHENDCMLRDCLSNQKPPFEILFQGCSAISTVKEIYMEMSPKKWTIARIEVHLRGPKKV